MWSKKVKEEALIACARRCCICHRFCGRNIELHHIEMESRGGESTFDNGIPLCFDCHSEAGHYNALHPKGTKYSPSELIKHRDNWYQAVKELSHLDSEWENGKHKDDREVYEGQEVTLKGFVWQEAFPSFPNYEFFEKDQVETYWMLVLFEPIILYTNCFETNGTIKIENVRKLQLCVDSNFYKQSKDIVRTDVELTGTLFRSITGHHHGDANFTVANKI